MTYNLKFKVEALKEWKRLDNSLKKQFKKKLAERLEEPHVASARLHRSRNRYKIKLRSSGYRLVYEVHDETVTVEVLVIGRRDKSAVYAVADRR